MIFNISGGYGSGGGASNNFELVYGNTRPENPSDNTVWVQTIVPITEYYLQADRPESPIEGAMWISLRDSGANKITTAIAKEWITVYPISASQYINGVWNDKSVECYQFGTWNTWWNGEILDGFNQFEVVTGGWIQDTNLNISGYSNTGTVTFDDDGITLSAAGTTSAVVRTKNKIKLSDYSTLIANAKSITATSNISVRVYIITGASGDVDNMKAGTIENITSTSFTDYELPLNLDDEYYIALVVSANRSGTVKKIRLV